MNNEVENVLVKYILSAYGRSAHSESMEEIAPHIYRTIVVKDTASGDRITGDFMAFVAVPSDTTIKDAYESGQTGWVGPNLEAVLAEVNENGIGALSIDGTSFGPVNGMELALLDEHDMLSANRVASTQETPMAERTASGAQFLVDSASAEVFEASPEGGDGKGVNGWDIKVSGKYGSTKEAITAVAKWHGWDYSDVDWIVFEESPGSPRIDGNVLVDKDNGIPSAAEKAAWEKGEMQLYYAYITVYIEVAEIRSPTVAELEAGVNNAS